MPGPYNVPESRDDAHELSKFLGIKIHEIPIDKMFTATKTSLDQVFKGCPEDVTEENIQARLRGLILMAVANKFKYLLLNTGNKSELAVGYCTLYGDMNGGLSVLGDVYKTQVYKLAKWINQIYGWIPERIIKRPPSAELSPNQKDEDSLPRYELLDTVLESYIENGFSVSELIKEGYELSTINWIVGLINKNEYKRRQAPPVLKVSSKAFGFGRRLPIAQNFLD
jgi:NAD+ synthetase